MFLIKKKKIAPTAMNSKYLTESYILYPDSGFSARTYQEIISDST